MKSDKTKEQAIHEAIESCIEDGILTDILKKEKVRIMASILAEFDEIGYAQMLRDEGREQGIEEGRARAIVQSVNAIMNNLNVVKCCQNVVTRLFQTSKIPY